MFFRVTLGTQACHDAMEELGWAASEGEGGGGGGRRRRGEEGSGREKSRGVLKTGSITEDEN